MQGLISFLGLAIWIAVWVLIVRRRKRMGLFLANVGGLVGGFVAFAAFIAVVAPEPTAEDRQDREAARLEADKVDATAKAKREQEAVASAAVAAKAKKERDDAAAVAAANQDRSVMASIICSNYVEASLKSPKSADFPWNKAAGGTKVLGDQTYFIRSYVDAQNSYGAELRNWYDCKIQYKSGEDVNPASWKLLSLQFSQ